MLLFPAPGLQPRGDVVVDDGNVLRAAQRRLQRRRGEGDEHVRAAGDGGVDQRGDGGHVALRVQDLDLEVAPIHAVPIRADLPARRPAHP